MAEHSNSASAAVAVIDFILNSRFPIKSPFARNVVKLISYNF